MTDTLEIVEEFHRHGAIDGYSGPLAWFYAKGGSGSLYIPYDPDDLESAREYARRHFEARKVDASKPA